MAKRKSNNSFWGGNPSGQSPWGQRPVSSPWSRRSSTLGSSVHDAIQKRRRRKPSEIERTADEYRDEDYGDFEVRGDFD